MAGSDLVSPIVVGVSRRTGSAQALRWAAAEARLRNTRVLAVTAWRGPRPPAASGGRPPAIPAAPIEEAFKLEEQRIFDQLTSELGADPGSLGVRYSLRRGSPTTVLLAAAVGAQLLVLDSPRAGRRTLARSLITPQLVFRSPCPVVVMPPPLDSADDVLATGGLTEVPDPA
ncbi:MAG: universal stress protein [Jatrophihabitantaceae bacterium]